MRDFTLCLAWGKVKNFVVVLIIRKGNVALSNLKNGRVSLSNLKNGRVALSNLRKCHFACR